MNKKQERREMWVAIIEFAVALTIMAIAAAVVANWAIDSGRKQAQERITNSICTKFQPAAAGETQECSYLKHQYRKDQDAKDQ